MEAAKILQACRKSKENAGPRRQDFAVFPAFHVSFAFSDRAKDDSGLFPLSFSISMYLFSDILLLFSCFFYPDEV